MNIGEKLRLMRGSMTQAELSRRSGIDKAVISKIESDKMHGTVHCHQKLAGAFGLKLSEWYAYIENGKPGMIEAHQAGIRTDYYQDFMEFLTAIPLSKKMLPAVITLKPNEERYLEETLKKAERFILVLQGEAEIEAEGVVHRLKKEPDRSYGDSIYSLSPARHRIRNTGALPCCLLCVSAPPVL